LLEHQRIAITIVENDSPNDSMKYLQEWIDGRLNAPISTQNPLDKSQGHTRNCTFVTLQESDIFPHSSTQTYIYQDKSQENTVEITLIKASANRGYAAGNNIGIRYALSREADFVWILNNDIVVEPDALSHLLKSEARHRKEGKKNGLYGSLLLYFDTPTMIQAFGGTFSRNLCVCTNKFRHTPLRTFSESDGMETDYVVGAAILASRAFLEDVGLMFENYFLGFEEIDWATQARSKGWSIFTESQSIVYHKESETTKRQTKDIIVYYNLRNPLLFTHRFYPHLFLQVWSYYYLRSVAGKILKGNMKEFMKVTRWLLQFLKKDFSHFTPELQTTMHSNTNLSQTLDAHE
jgi:GT2 family glycosyltransferase